MKTNTVFASLLFTGLLALVSGCSKSGTGSQNNTPVSNKVKSVIYYSTYQAQTFIDTTHYSYDAQGRMVSYTSRTESGSFTISGNNVSIYNSLTSQAKSGNLDANGHFNHMATASSGPSYPSYDEYFTYDSTGALISDSVTSHLTGGPIIPQRILRCTWSNGNLVSAAWEDLLNPGTPANSYTYTYLADNENRENGLGRSRNFLSYAMGIIAGKNSKNLIHVENENYADGTTLTSTHSYTFDTHGRVAIDTKSLSTGELAVYTYTYY